MKEMEEAADLGADPVVDETGKETTTEGLDELNDAPVSTILATNNKTDKSDSVNSNNEIDSTPPFALTTLDRAVEEEIIFEETSLMDDSESPVEEDTYSMFVPPSADEEADSKPAVDDVTDSSSASSTSSIMEAVTSKSAHVVMTPRQTRHAYRAAPMTMTMRLAELIKILWSPDPKLVTASLMQLHKLVDESIETQERNPAAELQDNALELAVVRRGGQLALLHALQRHPTVNAIQALGFGALSWLCEKCNVKSALVAKGAVPLVCAVLRTAPPAVATEALYFLGHLSTLPKVAEQVTVRDDTVLHAVVYNLNQVTKHGHESAVDALFFLCQRLAAHQSSAILISMWKAGCLAFVVRHLQDAVQEYQGGHWDEEPRLEVGCRMLTSWAKTKCSSSHDIHVVQSMIEAGALTLAAELVRLFPPGTPLRKVANPCLRAMVPSTED